MNAKFSFLSLLLLVLFSTQISLANETAAMLARKAVSENAYESSTAIEELRALGPAGLAALMAEHADEIKRHLANPKSDPAPEWQRITRALDLVGQQKNNFVSGLYWYTDIEDAKRAARAGGKPILSLRLLGNLTDELSCANSRFFRTVLYPNAQVGAMMRDRFILHWKSVRPAPVITIDFGDGRKLERTVTGNSIHYVLDSEGRLLEAMPGLYGPTAFRRGLANAENLFQSLAGKNDRERNLALLTYYRDCNNKIGLAWNEDTVKIGGKIPEGLTVFKDESGQALAIGPLAVTKMVTENTWLRAMTNVSEAFGRITDEPAWRKIADLHAADSRLDDRSLALIRYQNPALSNVEMTKLVGKFQELIALDTVRNEYLLHPKLYSWLAREDLRKDVDNFNEHVYATVFLTPRSDPWLGLLSPDVYTAIDNGGVMKGR
jgi:hypothetical protein